MAGSSHAMAGMHSYGAGSSSAAAGSSSSGTAGSKGLSVLEVEEGVRRSADYFGFSPVRFVDDVYNCAAAYMKRGLDQMEEVLLEDHDTRQNSKEIEEGVARTHEKLTKSLDRNIDKFELYIVRNILSVPSHLDTSGVEQMAVESSASHTKEEEDQLDEQLVELRRKVQAAEFVKKAMTEKMEELDREVANYKTVATALDELDAKVEEQFSAHGVQGSLSSVLLDVMHKDPQLKALDKQYAALESMGGQEGAVIGESENVSQEKSFLRCRKGLGAPSTRALDELAAMLA